MSLEDLRRKLAELESRNERLTKIFEHTNDAIFLTDPGRDKILDVNPRACEMLGYERPELLRLGMSAIHPNEIPRLRQFADRVFKTGTGWTDELSCVTKSGVNVAAEISASVFDIDGRRAMIALVRDISERKELEAALAHQSRLLEEQVRDRTDELRRSYEEIKHLRDQLAQENIYLLEEIETEHKFDDIVGRSPATRQVLRNVETVAPTSATVLITGETGTGKGLIARAIHSLSPRRAKPLVKVNCAALPAELIESELFGYERGAFTGAAARRIGRFELANGGAIFLDEIGELPLPLQAKLLSVLQDNEFQRVGGSETLKLDVQVIAATNRDLEAEVIEGRFRSDLYYRLNVFPIALPPLRERPEDIAPLVHHFVVKYSVKLGKQIKTIPKESVEALTSYSWPGNIRELENLVERAIILSSGSRLNTSSWKLKPHSVSSSGVPTLDDVQRQHILEVLDLTGWRVSGVRGAARLLGMKPTTLESRMKKLGIKRLK